MRIYESILQEHPFPRSIKNIISLATIRGATSGVQHAETFKIIREIEKDV